VKVDGGGGQGLTTNLKEVRIVHGLIGKKANKLRRVPLQEIHLYKAGLSHLSYYLVIS
jgi:hypothetical protein